MARNNFEIQFVLFRNAQKLPIGCYRTLDEADFACILMFKELPIYLGSIDRAFIFRVINSITDGYPRCLPSYNYNSVKFASAALNRTIGVNEVLPKYFVVRVQWYTET